MKAPARHYGALAVALGLALYLYVTRRLFLGDPTIDWGSELYTTWRLFEGAVLYRDLFYLYGPLPPYLAASFMALAGPTWAAMATMNFFFFLGILLLLFSFLKRRLSPPLTAVVLLFTVLVFGFNQQTSIGNYNFLTPYRTGVVQGLFFALLSLTFLYGPKNTRSVFWAGFALGAVFLSKAEIFFALAFALAFTYAFSRWLRQPLFRGFALLAGLAGSISLALALWCWQAGATPWVGAEKFLGPYLLPFHPGIQALDFYQNTTGLFAPGTPLFFARALLSLALGVILPAILFWFVSRLPEEKKRDRAALALGGLLITTFLGLLFARPEILSQATYWPLASPFVNGVAAAWCFYRAWSGCARGTPAQTTSARLNEAMIFTFAAALTLRVLFSAWSVHYGFALALPGTLTFLWLILAWPTAHWRGKTRVSWTAWVTILALAHGYALNQITDHYLRQKKVAFRSGPANFYYYPGNTEAIVSLAAYLDESHAGAKTLTVLPEGLFFNFLLRKPSPLVAMSGQPEQLAYFGQEEFTRQLSSVPADIIAIFPRNTEDFNLGTFPAGYGRAQYEWIRSHYIADSNRPPNVQGYQIEVFFSPTYAKKIGR